jgi:hypothetical protein
VRHRSSHAAHAIRKLAVVVLDVPEVSDCENDQKSAKIRIITTSALSETLFLVPSCGLRAAHFFAFSPTLLFLTGWDYCARSLRQGLRFRRGCRAPKL